MRLKIPRGGNDLFRSWLSGHTLCLDAQQSGVNEDFLKEVLLEEGENCTPRDKMSCWLGVWSRLLVRNPSSCTDLDIERVA